MSDAMEQLSATAFCWKLQRRDGAGLALTSHDRALTVGGVRYEAAPGMVPTSIRSELGIEPNASEVGGALSSDAISGDDINSGRWDGAVLSLIAVDWAAPNDDAVELMSGELGQIGCRDGEFSVDLLGASAKLQRPICPQTAPECRADLGDAECRVDMAGRTRRAQVIQSIGQTLFVDTEIDERFRFGAVRFLAGKANGERRVILAVAERELLLRSAPSFDVPPGTPVEIVEGCDKRFATCAERFANAVNFCGEPHLPGNDLLTRYPGA
jgi:uncharacterized phage protein (TIGR02218 family)